MAKQQQAETLEEEQALAGTETGGNEVGEGRAGPSTPEAAQGLSEAPAVVSDPAMIENANGSATANLPVARETVYVILKSKDEVGVVWHLEGEQTVTSGGAEAALRRFYENREVNGGGAYVAVAKSGFQPAKLRPRGGVSVSPIA